MPTDLMTMLLDNYKDHNKKQRLLLPEIKDLPQVDRDIRASVEPDEAALVKFVEFCKTTLRKTPPVSVSMSVSGIALRLADGRQIPVVSDPKQDMLNTAQGLWHSMPITGTTPDTNNPLPVSPAMHVFGAN